MNTKKIWVIAGCNPDKWFNVSIIRGKKCCTNAIAILSGYLL